MVDADIKAESSDKRLNDLVAVTVVLFSTFMAVSAIKDDNVVQAMDKAKAEEVDAWTEYQASRIKLQGDENGLSHLRLLQTGGGIDQALAAKQAAEYEADITKYQDRSAETMARAKALNAEYNRLNFHDDQFDLSDAFLSIGVSVTAVAALVNNYILLYISWGAGALGLSLGAAGFAGWSFHPDWLARLLGT